MTATAHVPHAQGRCNRRLHWPASAAEETPMGQAACAQRGWRQTAGAGSSTSGCLDQPVKDRAVGSTPRISRTVQHSLGLLHW